MFRIHLIWFEQYIYMYVCIFWRVLEVVHASFVESVPIRYTAIFTVFQIVYFLVCFGVTWIPIAGILFPLPFFLLIVIRQYLLPKLFQSHHLHELDAAEYEEIAGAPQRSLSLSFRVCAPEIACAPQIYTTIVCVRFFMLFFTGKSSNIYWKSRRWTRNFRWWDTGWTNNQQGRDKTQECQFQWREMSPGKL